MLVVVGFAGVSPGFTGCLAFVFERLVLFMVLLSGCVSFGSWDELGPGVVAVVSLVVEKSPGLFAIFRNKFNY